MQEFRPTPRHVQKLSVADVGALPESEFVEKIGRLFPSGKWIAETAFRKRPFKSIYDLRRALQDAMFEAPQERQLELIRSYPDLGRFMQPEAVSALSARTEQRALTKSPPMRSKVWPVLNRCGTRVRPVSIGSPRKNQSHSTP